MSDDRFIGECEVILSSTLQEATKKTKRKKISQNLLSISGNELLNFRDSSLKY